MLLKSFRFAFYLMADVTIIGCILHFLCMCLLMPGELVDLEQRIDSAFASATHLRTRDRLRALSLCVYSSLYFLVLLVGLGLIIYGGLSWLFSWIPRSWDAENLAGISAFMGALGLVAITNRAAHRVGDLEDAIRELTLNSGNLDYFRRFLLHGKHQPDAKYRPNGWALLHQLAALGNQTLPIHARMAEDLLRSGANVNCRTVLGWTPLHFIAMQGQKQAVELARVLIKHGLDLTAVDNLGRGWKDHWQDGKEIYELLENTPVR